MSMKLIDQQDLNDQNKRHTDAETEMTGLMAEEEHTGQSSRTSSEYGRKKKRTFPDPPDMLFGSSLINAHEKKSSQIDQDDITV